jgi:hypothetical protein
LVTHYAYGCDALPLTVKERHKLQVLVIVLWKTFGLKVDKLGRKWIILHYDDEKAKQFRYVN